MDLAAERGVRYETAPAGEVVPFTAQTRMSGLDLPDGSIVRKGAGSAVIAWVEEIGAHPVERAGRARPSASTRSPSSGGTPLVVAEGAPTARRASSASCT